jgi:hypothetical protein
MLETTSCGVVGMSNTTSSLIDAFSHHEALHMSSKLLQAVNEWLVEHPAIQADKERLKLATQAADTLMELYQLIGRQSL